jgi:hypothetical protein
VRKLAALTFLTLLACSPAPTAEDAGTSTGGGGAGGGTPATGGGGGTGGGSTTQTDAGFDAGAPGSADAGSPCSSPTDCASNTCIAWFRDAGSVCARPCFDQTQCADLPDFVCIPDRDGSGVCVPKSPAHCLPCDFDVNCGGLSEACVVAPGDTMMTCRIDCSLAGAAACPPDYTCTETRFNNVNRSFCTPPAGRCASSPGGFCDRFSEPQPCATTNDAGTCVGDRTCVNGRFTACDAPTAACRTCSDALRPDCTEDLCPGATTVPSHCGACGNACPGAGLATANVLCADGGCTFSCRGQNYDSNTNASNGCEVADTPTGNHTAAGATNVGTVPCNDGSTISGTGTIPSDTRVHENPSFTGFSVMQGAAPDYLAVSATGGTFCVNDIELTLTVTQAANLACFRLTVTTDEGTWSCTTNAAGTCGVNQGSGSYSGDTTISLLVERTCSAAGTTGRYTVAGHF